MLAVNHEDAWSKQEIKRTDVPVVSIAVACHEHASPIPSEYGVPAGLFVRKLVKGLQGDCMEGQLDGVLSTVVMPRASPL